MPIYFDLLKYAKTGLASPDMTAYDKAKALAMCGGGLSPYTIIGQPPISFKSDGTPLTSVVIKGNGQQSGTPTPSAPVDLVGCGDRTAQLWDKGVPVYVYAKDYKKYNPNNAVTLAAGTYCISTDGKMPTIQAFNANHDQYNVSDIMTYSNEYYSVWDGKAIGPRAAHYSSATITLQSDCTITFAVTDNAGTYIMLTSGSTAPTSYIPYGWQIPLTNASVTTPLYLGEQQTVRRIKKLVLTGNEGTWYYRNGDPPDIWFISKSDLGIDWIPYVGICDRAVCGTSSVSDLQEGEFILSAGNLGLRLPPYTSANNAWPTYLAEQYAAGTPVCIWYVLAEPETGIVNEPLYRIGDYCDELTTTTPIPTAKGSNTLSVDTTVQPSEVSITGNIKPTT